MRFVTPRQNNQNRKNQIRASQYPGVCWENRRKYWYAKIVIKGVQKYLGSFTSEKEAFEAYRKAVNAIDEEVIDFRK